MSEGRAKKPYTRMILAGILLAASLALLAIFAFKVNTGARDEQARVLREALVRTAVTCYAVEGKYPESVQYMIDNYGISVDSSEFIVSYEVFADNLMPDIRVLVKGRSVQ